MRGETKFSSAEERFGLDACMISFAMRGNPVVNQNLDRARQNGNTIKPQVNESPFSYQGQG
jgi:hypothetical protein